MSHDRLSDSINALTDRANRAEASLAELKADIRALAAKWERDDPIGMGGSEGPIADLRALPALLQERECGDWPAPCNHDPAHDPAHER